MADTYINSDTADIPSVNFAQQGSDVTAPAASRWQLFFKSTGLWAITNAASAFRFAKHVMTAAGDLTVGGASGVETVLAKGSALDVLRVNAGGTALEWAAPAEGPAAALLLDYQANTDLHTGTALTATTWTDDSSNQSFTVTDAGARIVVAVSGACVVGNPNVTRNVSTRVVIDSAGTPINRTLTGSHGAPNAYSLHSLGSGPVDIGTLSAAVHTIKLQVYVDSASNNLYQRCSSNPTTEPLSLQVWQVPQ